MLASRKTRLRESRIEALKARARAKQQWLEQTLASSDQAATKTLRRQHWIADALHRIKRAKADAMYRASLLDAYTEHLSVLEMTLMRAAEERDTKAESSKS
jgi:hypothetical protein